ncbi:MAG: type III secretion system invasion protein IagB [Plesiomonas shigelloides]|uniref:type III secretion system invasion protein IagB n=1 Tax=Plesiomonas shigelloides TaxID=703 RepID=UPI00126219B6|nr:type III secretion system invasion protein IagB [Plesiomonas shigelloides]KAB7715291.1 type III secretion system invasion protein IagB [Plesiomonas shigelloides]
MRKTTISLLLLSGVNPAQANCWDHAASTFNISPQLLYAIAQQESALNPNAIGHNADGSQDFGLMQINSIHLPRLRQLGINEQSLKDPCISIIVGASILADMMQRYGYSWEAVGAYNAGTAPERYTMRMRYANKVWERYHRLIKEK